jgi:hypothetical protein
MERIELPSLVLETSTLPLCYIRKIKNPEVVSSGVAMSLTIFYAISFRELVLLIGHIPRMIVVVMRAKIGNLSHRTKFIFWTYSGCSLVVLSPAGLPMKLSLPSGVSLRARPVVK